MIFARICGAIGIPELLCLGYVRLTYDLCKNLWCFRHAWTDLQTTFFQTQCTAGAEAPAVTVQKVLSLPNKRPIWCPFPRLNKFSILTLWRDRSWPFRSSQTQVSEILIFSRLRKLPIYTPLLSMCEFQFPDNRIKQIDSNILSNWVTVDCSLSEIH